MNEYYEEDLLLYDDNGEFVKGCPECKTDAYLMDDYQPIKK
jgi:hypothetical protein